MDCNGCVWYYYESDTNWKECRHEDYDIENPDHCPGEYAIEDAKADAKYKDCDKY
uniref:Uncharacterized protein n=1 Tax=viral metagenome TaxID=1070528 RepID=A0A6M3LHC3_9ZZZZ